MAKVESYTCDMCGKQKGEVNHWFIGDVFGDHITIHTWVKNVVDGIHLCGLECATKWIQQQLQNLNEQNKNEGTTNGN